MSIYSSRRVAFIPLSITLNLERRDNMYYFIAADVTLQPAGVGEVLLRNVNLQMPEKGLGLIVGAFG